MKIQKWLQGVCLGVGMAMLFSACGFSEAAQEQAPLKETTAVALKAPSLDKTPIKDSYAAFQTNMGTFKVRLYGSKTPITVRNFMNLTEKGYYNGLTFHRIIDGFMIQGGDPSGNGTGGPGYEFPDEIVKDLYFDKPGLLAMANHGPNTNSSQFFITVAPAHWLDNKYTIFGTVVQGMDVVEKISKVQTGKNDKPLKPVIIEKITLEPLNNGK